MQKQIDDWALWQKCLPAGAWLVAGAVKAVMTLGDVASFGVGSRIAGAVALQPVRSQRPSRSRQHDRHASSHDRFLQTADGQLLGADEWFLCLSVGICTKCHPLLWE